MVEVVSSVLVQVLTVVVVIKVKIILTVIVVDSHGCF